MIHIGLRGRLRDKTIGTYELDFSEAGVFSMGVSVVSPSSGAKQRKKANKMNTIEALADSLSTRISLHPRVD